MIKKQKKVKILLLFFTSLDHLVFGWLSNQNLFVWERERKKFSKRIITSFFLLWRLDRVFYVFLNKNFVRLKTFYFVSSFITHTFQQRQHGWWWWQHLRHQKNWKKWNKKMIPALHPPPRVGGGVIVGDRQQMWEVFYSDLPSHAQWKWTNQTG